jgi:hypothetical protein
MEKEGFWFEWSIQVITEAQKLTACYTITVVIFKNSVAGTISDQFRAVLIRMQTQGKGAQNFLRVRARKLRFLSIKYKLL